MDELMWGEQLAFASKQESEEEADWKLRFISEVEKESERGQVLTIVSFIDELLIGILKSFSPNKEHAEKLLTELDSCLGTIMDRANIAFMLSLIDEIEYKSIKQLARIRNEFAHKWDGTSFGGEAITKIVKSFPKELFVRINGSNKAKFMRVSSHVIQELISRRNYCEKLRNVIPSSYRDIKDISLEERQHYFSMERNLHTIKSFNIDDIKIFFGGSGEFIYFKIKVKDPNKMFIVHS